MSTIKYDNVLAVRPEYIQDKGDCTEIIYESGETYITERTINSFMNIMAHYFNTDLRANRYNYGKKLGIKNNVPIVLSDKYIFVPYKVRKPMSKRDCAYGFINLFNYADLYEGQEDNFIVTTEGIKLKLCERIVSFSRRVNLSIRLINERR
jgi:hypothetical protein